MRLGATGPYFADVSRSAEGIDSWSAYLLSFLLAVTISSLVSIQEALEDPFDGDTPLDGAQPWPEFGKAVASRNSERPLPSCPGSTSRSQLALGLPCCF